MMPVRRVKAQPCVWPMTTEPPPWVWTVPNTAGLCALSPAPHPTLLTSTRPAPPLRAVTSWQLSCDPFLPPLISPLPVPNIQVASHLLPTAACKTMFTHFLIVFHSSCVTKLQTCTQQQVNSILS